MLKVNVIGDSLIDLNFGLPRQLIHRYQQSARIELPFGDKLSTDDYQLTLGGSGANVSIGLRKAGLGVWFATGFASDVFGPYLRAELEKEGIELRGITQGERTPISVILRSGGERTIVTSRPVGSALPNEVPRRGWIHLGPLHAVSLEDFAKKLLAQQVETSQSISLNPSIECLEERDRGLMSILKTTAVIFVNSREAQALTRLHQRTPLPELARSVNRLGPKIVCLTDGERGAYLSTEAGVHFASALVDRSTRLDTTGAGDAFASGFLAAYLSYENEKEGDELLSLSLAAAIVNAGSVVGSIGGQDGLLSLEQMEQDIRRVKIRRVE